MKTKRYKSKEKPLPKVEEPVALDEKPEGFDACYAKLKAKPMRNSVSRIA